MALRLFSLVLALAGCIVSSGSVSAQDVVPESAPERLPRGAAPADPLQDEGVSSEGKLFAVRFTTGPSWDAAKRFNQQQHSTEHSANLRRMRVEGFIVLGGRFAETGWILVRAPDEAAVHDELARDPSIEAGTFHVTVDEYRPFFSLSEAPITTERSAEAAVVREAIAAFNAHDAEAFVALCADDLMWLSVAEDSLSVDGEGRESIRAWLERYFESLPDVRSEVTDLTQSGAHVAFRERTTWTARDGTARAQEALAVYEVRDGEIRRAWYFPRQSESPPT